MLPEKLTDDLGVLAAQWITAKQTETDAIADRRRLEDRIKSLAGISENLEGTETVSPEGYSIKISGRLERKVDGDKLQDLALEHGLTEHLSRLFRWKPEVNLKLWRDADPSVTAPLAGAITVAPGRPTFKIEEK